MEKHYRYIPWAIIAVLAFLLWVKSCGSDDSDTNVVTIPAISGTMTTVDNPKPLPTPTGQPKQIIKWDTLTIETENPVNLDYIARFQKAQDSLERLKLYADAIGEREYNIRLEDSVLITNNYIKARGEVLQFKQDYTRKEFKTPVKAKKTVLRMLGGVEIGNTVQLNDFSAKANLMLQNQKGNIFSAGYDTEQRIYVGYSISIFNIKK